MDSSDLEGILNFKVIGIDQSVIAATDVHWRLPGVRLRLAISLSLSVRIDLLGCQSQYKRTEGKGNKG